MKTTRRPPSRDSKYSTRRDRDTERRPGRRDYEPRTSDRKSKEKRGTEKRGAEKRSSHSAERRSSKEKRPKMTRGPWTNNAYLPSTMMGPAAVKPVKPAKPRRASGVQAPRPEQPEATTTHETPESDGKERLQKVLARCGVASRRKAELLILEGAVTVNGRPAVELGTKVDPKRDKIKVNGSLIFTEVEPIYIALYKPKGMISSLSDPEGRRHIGHIVSSVRERVVPMGRLDYNSEGLILLTNDGELADKIIKARNLPKIYMVKIKGHPSERDLEVFKRGFFTADGVIRFSSFGIEQTLKSKSWLKLEVVEGSKLDLREMLNHKGLLVDRIVRTAIGSISIKGLKPGEYRFLKRQDFEEILKQINN